MDFTVGEKLKTALLRLAASLAASLAAGLAASLAASLSASLAAGLAAGLSVVAVQTWSLDAGAQLNCPKLFSDESRDESALTKAATKEWQSRRDGIVTFLKANPSVPAFMKATANGPVAVIMLNEETLPILRPMLERSVGFGVELKPDEFNPDGTVARVRGDHGMMRIQTDLVDLGQQGDRQGGPSIEFNWNGIGWKKLEKVLPWKQPIIQNSYLMPPGDLNVVRYFHLVRRASLFRTRFSFAEEARHLNYENPNFFESIVENCFDFCKSQQTDLMISEIQASLQKLVGARLEEIQASSAAKRFVNNARAKLLAVDAFDRTQLNFSTPEAALKRSGLLELLPPSLSEREQLTVGNLLIAFNATKAYARLLNTYQVSLHHGFNDLQTMPVSFVTIVARPQLADDFRAGRYSAAAKWHNWTTEGQTPLH